MRLVDADAFKAEGRELYRYAGWDLRDVHYSQMDVECNIDMMPTVEAEPVKHGRWVKDNGPYSLYKCSACNDYCTVAGWANCIPEERMYKGFKYCPNCGAKMEAEEE